MKKFLYTILIILFLILTTLIYSRFIGTSGLKTNEIALNTNISESYNGLKIIHFSDLHYKKIITEKRVTDLIKEINKTKPDLVIFTGDLLDKEYTLTNDDINFLITELSTIETKYGKFAILGDHDLDMEEQINNIYIQSDFTILKNDYTIIQNEHNAKIFIGGLNSYTKDMADIDKIFTYFNNNEDIPYKIILTHEPDIIDELLTKHPDISLILSAHSINGSINLPVIKKLLLPEGAQKYYKPYYQINNTDIYISNGIGVNKFNFRLFNTPSINFYRIYKD